MLQTLFCVLFLLCSCEVDQNISILNKKQPKIKSSELAKITIQNFYARPLSTLLDTIKTKPIRIHATAESPFHLSGCFIEFPNDTLVVVLFKKIYFQRERDTSMLWDVDLLKKEFIFRMGIHIKGMPVKMQYYATSHLDSNAELQRMRESVKGIPLNELPIELVKDLEKE